MFTHFFECLENVEGTKHCKKRCFGYIRTPQSWYLRSFLPVRVPNPCKLHDILYFLSHFFALVIANNGGVDAFFQNSKIVTFTKPCTQQCFNHFRGITLWNFRGFFPSDSSKCCKLQRFVHSLCSIFRHAMLSYAPRSVQEETTLQIEIGRPRDPKDSWREESHRNLCTHRSFFTLFTQSPTRLHTEAFTWRSLCTEELLYTKACPPRNCYTQKLLYKEVFTRRASTHRRVYSQKFLHREAFTERAYTH